MITDQGASRISLIDPIAYLRVWQTGEFNVPLQPFITWLKSQRLLSLLIWRAKRKGWILPEEVSKVSQMAVYEMTANYAIVDQQIKRLSKIVRDLQIPAVVVKGPVVAERYPDVALRSYNDLDFLVPESKANPLIEALLQCGYVRKTVGDRSPHYPPLCPEEGKGLCLEVHTALDPLLDNEQFTYDRWSEGLQRWLSYPSLLIPDDVDHAVYLVDHTVIRHELLGGILLLTDLRFWTERWEEVKWRLFKARSRDAGLLRASGLALALNAWIWDEPLPDLVSKLFPAPPNEVLAESQALVLGSLPTFMPHVWRDLPANRPDQWIGYAVKAFVGDPEYRRDLSIREKLLFYIRRPFRLWRYYAPAMWRLINGRDVERQAWQAHREVTTWLRELD